MREMDDAVDFPNKIKELGRQQGVSVGVFRTRNRIDYWIENEDLNSVTYSFEGNLLKSVMQTVVIDSNVEIEKGKVITMYYYLLDEDAEEGTVATYYIEFYVYSCEKKEDTGSYEIKAYDKMINTMKKYEPVNITYPCTLSEYIKAVCDKLGFSYDTNQQFANKNKMLDRDFFEGLDYTYRDVLDDIAEVTGSTIYLKSSSSSVTRYRDPKLIIGYPVETGVTLDENSFKDINVKFGEKYGPINSVVLSRSAGSDNVYLQDEDSVKQNGLCEIKIIDNQIMNLNNRSEYLPEILQKLKNISYYLNDYTSTGIMYLELLDYYDVKIGDNTYRCLMLNDEQDITQGLEEQIHTDRPETSETDYTKADKTDQRINQTYLIVDKQNQTINSLISSNTETVQKVNQLDASVEQLSSKISETADVTKNAEGYGKVDIAEVNASEPVMIKVHPTGLPVRPLYPSDKIYPSDYLYPHNRELEFRRIENGNIVDKAVYNLPADLYWYSNTVYDEFVLDYENQKCYVTRRTAYDSTTDTVTALQVENTENYDYPAIKLDNGDYTVIMPSFETAYIYARLMTKNIYTSQFATHVELNSAITQTKDNINLGVKETLTNYVTTTAMSSALNIKADEINLSVTDKLSKYSTTTEMNSAISLESNSILNTVSRTYTTKDRTNTIEASLELKVDKDDNDQIVSMINASADEINLKSNRLAVSSTYFALTKEGKLSCSEAEINGDITIPYGNNFKILDSSNRIFSSFNSYGMYLYESGIETGKIGTTSYKGDSSQKGLVFDLDDNGRFMSWGVSNSDRTAYNARFFYTRANSFGCDSEGIYFGTDAFLQGFDLHLYKDFRISSGNHTWGNDTSRKYSGMIWKDNNNSKIAWIDRHEIDFNTDNGVAVNGSLVQTGSSDGRLKHDISDTEINALPLLNQIEHRQFMWNKDNSYVDLGYIAQELEKIDDNLVIKNPQYDEKGNIIDYIYQVNILGIIALATKSIQELDTKVEKQQNVIDLITQKVSINQENKSKKSARLTKQRNKIDYGNKINYSRQVQEREIKDLIIDKNGIAELVKR